MRGSKHRIQSGHEIAVLRKLGRLAYRVGATARLGVAKLVNQHDSPSPVRGPSGTGLQLPKPGPASAAHRASTNRPTLTGLRSFLVASQAILRLSTSKVVERIPPIPDFTTC
jgi:hypothetical protein